MGLGLALARVFARNGFHLVLVARSAQLLESAAGVLSQQFPIRVKTIIQDLTQPEGPEFVFQQVQQWGLEIDVLVNNAGFGEYGPAWEIPAGRESAMIQLNIQALIRLTRLFLPEMLRRRSGKILQMASTAGFQPGPGMAVYFATKAFVLHYSEALAVELQGSGVSVTVYCPGPTQTGFEAAAHLEASRLFHWLPVANAEAVANRAYHSVMQRKTVVIDGWWNRFLIFTERFFPRWFVRRVVAMFLGKR